MFLRKKNNRPSDEAMQAEIKKSEEQRKESHKELKEVQELSSVLQRIRAENHIVHDLREVFGGR